MKEDKLDFILVPLGLCVMVLYHIWLLFRVIRHPTRTVMGINALNRNMWVGIMMEDPIRNGVLAVQTLRNNIMASTLLATMSIMLCSLIAVLMANSKNSGGILAFNFTYGDTSEFGLSLKFFSILICFLLAFLFNVQSIRYYSHASILINVPVKRIKSHLTEDYVGRTVNRGSYFWSLGLRAYYFSFPLFLWLFGPIPMIVSCFIMVVMLFFLDVSFDRKLGGERDEEEKGDHVDL